MHLAADVCVIKTHALLQMVKSMQKTQHFFRGHLQNVVKYVLPRPRQSQSVVKYVLPRPPCAQNVVKCVLPRPWPVESVVKYMLPRFWLVESVVKYVLPRPLCAPNIMDYVVLRFRPVWNGRKIRAPSFFRGHKNAFCYRRLRD